MRKTASTVPTYQIVASQGTYRRINSPSLTPEQVQCLNTARSLGLELTTPPTTPTPRLSHLTSSGAAHMISISSKGSTHRTARAVCTVLFSNPSAYAALSTATLQKGDALAISRVAGIIAAKKAADLIPLAHPGIGITGVAIEVELVEPSGGGNSTRTKHAEKEEVAAGTDLAFAGVSAASPMETASKATRPPNCKYGGVSITATVECEGKTGVEMEALTAASVAGLTVYDMCKAVDKGMVMQGLRVVKKTGGKSGDWVWDEASGEVRPTSRVQPGSTTKPTAAKAHGEGPVPAENPVRELEKLLQMNDKEFAAELHHNNRKRALLNKAVQERQAAEAQKEAEKARLKTHVAKCEEEIKSGERGRVGQERLDEARKTRRKWFESSAEGTVLVPETRDWMMRPE
jgi:molybdenum cofactor biosynthesis protein MoaC